ncbi:MAG: hypothetical protein II737_03415 [Mailhella sp.]|nr:hypothetical protein [Mailhella sp.]
MPFYSMSELFALDPAKDWSLGISTGMRTLPSAASASALPASPGASCSPFWKAAATACSTWRRMTWRFSALQAGWSRGGLIRAGMRFCICAFAKEWEKTQPLALRETGPTAGFFALFQSFFVTN